MKSTRASPGGSPSKAFSTIASTRSTTVGAGGRGHGQDVPDLLDDLLVSGIGEQHPVGTTAEEHTSPTGVPRFHDQRRLPSYAPTPPSSPITPVRRARGSRLVGRSPRYILSSRVTAAGARHSWGQGGIGVARATFVRRHRVGIASGARPGRRRRRRRGLRRHRERLQDARGRAQRRRRLGRQRQEGLVRPAQQADQPARRRRAQRGRQDPAGRRPGRRGGRHPQPQRRSRPVHRDQPPASSQDGGSAAIPSDGDVRMAGGTLASADAETGEVWAVRYDDRSASPS